MPDFHDLQARLEREDEEQREAARRGLERARPARADSWARSSTERVDGQTGVREGSKAARFSFLRSFSTKGHHRPNSLVSLVPAPRPRPLSYPPTASAARVGGDGRKASEGDGVRGRALPAGQQRQLVTSLAGVDDLLKESAAVSMSWGAAHGRADPPNSAPEVALALDQQMGAVACSRAGIFPPIRRSMPSSRCSRTDFH